MHLELDCSNLLTLDQLSPECLHNNSFLFDKHAFEFCFYNFLSLYLAIIFCFLNNGPYRLKIFTYTTNVSLVFFFKINVFI